MTQWEKLLGGYATGTLTGEERAALMQAALSDQALFDLLMDEDALRETLADPATRAALLRALEPASQTKAWWRNPWPWTGLGAVAAAVALFVILHPVNAPKPVQMAQNRPAATAPEPVPSVIETPKQLRLSQPEAPEKPVATAAPVPLPDRQMAMAPPPPPAAAPAAPAPASERVESSSVQAGANRPVVAQMAKKKEAAAEAAAEPLAVALSYQSEDGVWRALALESAVPANRPLRLQVTSAQAGLLALQPPLAEARALLAGVPTDISLPAQPPGPLRLRLAVVPRIAESLGRAYKERSESEARAVAAAGVLPLGSSLTREIRLRIE